MKLFVKLLFACIINAWGLLVPLTVYGQAVTLRQKISFSANKVTVADALDKLSSKVGITFSYNPDQVHSKRIVNVDMKNRMLLEVLDNILGPSQFGFRLSGKQVIIFQNKPNSSSLPSTNLRNQLADTVFIPVSSMVHDTLLVIDTVKKVDTIKVEVINGHPLEDVIVHPQDTVVVGSITYNLGLTISYMFSDGNFSSNSKFTSKLGDYRKYYSGMMLSGSIGIEASATHGKFTTSAGISITSFAQKLDYDYVINEGGYYKKDTLDPYYTISGTDTTWFYLVDSTYVPVDSRSFSYHLNNHTRYLELPLSLGCRFQLKKKQFLLRAGIIPGIFMSSDGYNIKSEEQAVISSRDIKSKNLVISYFFSAGLQIPLEKKMTLTTSLFFRSHMNSIYADFPIEMRYSAFGINATLVYKIGRLEK